MAGGGPCPLRDRLYTAMKQSAVIAADRDNYVSIIDELKHEINSLSCHMAKVQEDFVSIDSGMPQELRSFEVSLKELETQNDKLQQALERTAQEKDCALDQLKKNCEAYKFQICQLRETIVEKEQQIIELNAVLKHLQLDTRNGIECCSGTMVHRTRSDQELAELRLRVDQSNQKIEKLLSDLKHCHQQECFLLAETRKLNDELMDSKRKNSELTTQARRIGALLESQEDHRMELAQKYEALEGNFDDQAKKLRAANSQLNFLQDKFTSVEKRHDEYILENKLLRDEVISLKEKEATLIGKQKSLLDQAMKTENELYKAHDVINEQHNVLQRNQQAYEETVERMQESFADMKRQYNQLLCDYKELETEYDKQKSCMQQSEKLIESFRKWKEAQIQADDATRTSFRQYEEHIQQLLEQKQDFLSKYRKLYGDFTVLQTELDRLKTTQTRGAAIPDNIQSENSEVYQQISKRMELIRRTSRRVTEQCSAMHSEVALKDLPAAPSKSS